MKSRPHAAAKSRGVSFPLFMEKEIEAKELAGRLGTAKTYRSSLRRFRVFARETSSDISSLDASIIGHYQTWLHARDVTNNTVSFYMRTLRAVYSRMVKRGLASECHPFADVYTGIAKTRKRAISDADMRKIKLLDLAGSKTLEFTRDMFMLSFYLFGMSFVDLAFLRKSSLRDDAISYCRAKTGQSISIGVNGKIRCMLDKYPAAAESPYLLPIITRPGVMEQTQYLSALRIANRNLKKIGEMAGLQAHLTTYTSRHSWASIARMKNVEIGVISVAMGHQSETTTRIYLTALDNARVDRANELILRDL